MSKYYCSPYSECPCYRHESAQVVYCDGVTTGSVVHLAFDNRALAFEYKLRFCRKDYESCPIYKMLTEKEN